MLTRSLPSQEPYFQAMLDSNDLIDAHTHTNAPSTYIGSENRRIDYIFASPSIIDSIARSGTLSYLEGPQADHRAIYIDINADQALCYNPTDHKIPSAVTRDLKTGHPELVADYINLMKIYYTHHNTMEARIKKLHQDRHKIPREILRSELEKWDADQGRAMMHAESSLARPQGP